MRKLVAREMLLGVPATESGLDGVSPKLAALFGPELAHARDSGRISPALFRLVRDLLGRTMPWA
jgi:hypothetical protein